MGIPTPLLRAADIVTVIQGTPHNYFGAAVAPPVPYAGVVMGLALETWFTPMFWPPGAVTGSHQIAHSVLNTGLWVVQGGHKLGPLLAHVEIVPSPDDVLTIVQRLKSSCEVKFQNSEVTAQGAPVGSMLPILMNAVVCSDIISLPFAVSVTSLWNTVWHGTSVVDLVAGWVEYCVSAFFEFVGFLAGGGMGSPGSQSLSQFDAVADSFTPGFGDILGAEGDTFSSLAGAGVRWLGREYFGYQGPITVTVGGNANSWEGKQVSYTSNRDGSWSVAEQSSGPFGLTSSGHTYSRDAAGNQSYQRTDRYGPVTRSTTYSQSETGEWSRQDSLSESVLGNSNTTSPTPSSDPSVDWL